MFKGFRPILDAMKSFAKDESPIDIEVLNKATLFFVIFVWNDMVHLPVLFCATAASVPLTSLLHSTPPNSTLLYSTLLFCTVLHSPQQHCILYSTPLYSTPLHCTLLHCIPLYSSPLHVQYSTPLYSTPLYSTPLHILYCTPLYSTPLYSTHRRIYGGVRPPRPPFGNAHDFTIDINHNYGV